MTAYNAEKFIGPAILSIINQTYEDWELMIIDDASTDGTHQIIERYIEKYPKRKIWVDTNPGNKGHTFSMNQAMRLSTGDCFAWQDADDVSEPDRLAKQHGMLKKYALVTTHGITINEDGARIYNWYTDKGQRMPKGAVVRKFNEDCWLLLPSLMWHREVMEKIGYFDTNCVLAQDFNYLIRALKHFDFTVIPEELFKVRKHGNNVRSSARAKEKNWHLYALERAKERPTCF